MRKKNESPVFISEKKEVIKVQKKKPMPGKPGPKK